MLNIAQEGRFYVHYKGGLYFVNKISYDVDKKCEVITYTHVSGKSYIRTREGFEKFVTKYDEAGRLNKDWGNRPGSVCIRFTMLEANSKFVAII